MLTETIPNVLNIIIVHSICARPYHNLHIHNLVPMIQNSEICIRPIMIIEPVYCRYAYISLGLWVVSELGPSRFLFYFCSFFFFLSSLRFFRSTLLSNEL